MRVALVGPTKDRPETFRRAVAAVRPQVDVILTVAHGEQAEAYARPLVDGLVRWGGELNISAMWSAGIDLAEKVACGPFDVAVLNDDAVVEPGWFARLSDTMHAAGAAGASGSRQQDKPASIAGYAFLLDGAKRVRPDGRMRWWYSDDAVQRRCEAAGGFVVVNGARARNTRADEGTRANPVLREWSREDRKAFRGVYGDMPHPSNIHRGSGKTPLAVSAPSGRTPTHLLKAAGNRPVLVLDTPGWEDEHLRAAATAFDWFVFVKESTRLLDPQRFWAAVDARTEPAWLFKPPSCFMALYARGPLLDVLDRVRVRGKWDSVRLEASMASRLRMTEAVWPEVNDANILRVEDGEIVIGNTIIEKSKGSAWCGRCTYEPPGICPHIGAA